MPNQDQLLNLFTRIDERTALMHATQEKLVQKIDVMSDQQAGLTQRVAVLESRNVDEDIEQLRERLHALANTVHDVQMKLQSTTTIAEGHESMWSAIKAKWFECLVAILMAYIFYRMGIQGP